MTPRNWFVSWNAPCCAPVAASPESSVSALARLAPVRLKIGRKFPGSAPPLLKNALSALATLHWLRLKAQASALGPLGALGTTSWPSVAVRFKIASVAV
jgi:hypothetical protein